MDKLDNLTSMVAFAKVVETLSYTAAAKLLGVAKSSVSKEISQLEVRLGTKLLQRTTRQIQVTEVGRVYYQYCQRILSEVNNAELFIRQLHDEPIGNLRIVAPVTFGYQSVMPALNRFIKQNIHVNVDLELTDRAVDIDNDNFDLAIMIKREEPQQGLYKSLIDIEWGLYATPAYLSSIKPINKPDDLPRHDFILFRGPAHTISLPLRKDKQKIDIDVRSRFRANNSIALLNSALENIGIAYLPSYIADVPQYKEKLVRILPDWQMDVYKAYVQFKQEHLNSPQIRLFIEGLQDYLRNKQ